MFVPTGVKNQQNAKQENPTLTEEGVTNHISERQIHREICMCS